MLHNPWLFRSFLEEDVESGCSTDYAPVCGKDGKTYTNSCESKLAGIAVARVGKCQNSPEIPKDTPSSTSSWDIQIPEWATPPIAIVPQVIPVWLVMTWGEIDMTKYHIYTNTNFSYTVLIPKYAYYQGLITPDKKNHILTIDLTASGVQNTSTALIKATYYKPLQDPDIRSANKVISLQNGGKVLIEYTEPLSKKWQEILDTLISTWKSLQ